MTLRYLVQLRRPRSCSGTWRRALRWSAQCWTAEEENILVSAFTFGYLDKDIYGGGYICCKAGLGRSLVPAFSFGHVEFCFTVVGKVLHNRGGEHMAQFYKVRMYLTQKGVRLD